MCFFKTKAWALITAPLTVTILAGFFAAASPPAPRLPAEPVQVDALLPSVPAHDLVLHSFADPEGLSICVIALENDLLFAYRSLDGGASFSEFVIDVNVSDDVDVASKPGGEAWVTWTVPSEPAEGGRRVRVAYAPNYCETFSRLSELPDPRAGKPRIAAASGADDVVALTYVTENDLLLLRVSENGGISWPVIDLLDYPAELVREFGLRLEVAVSANGENAKVFMGNSRGSLLEQCVMAQLWERGVGLRAESFCEIGPEDWSTLSLQEIVPVHLGDFPPTVAARYINSDVNALDQIAYGQCGGERDFESIFPEPEGAFGPLSGAPGTVPGENLLAWISVQEGAAGRETTLEALASTGVDSWGCAIWEEPTSLSAEVGAYLALAQSATGAWALATQGFQDSDENRFLYSRIEVRTSLDRGQSWSEPTRIDRADCLTCPETAIDVGSLAAFDTHDVFVTWSDERNADNDSADLYASEFRADAGPGSSPVTRPERRIDIDEEFRRVSPTVYSRRSLATDGNGRVYAAFVAESLGIHGAVFVASSEPGGLGFSNAERVSEFSSGHERLVRSPVIAATPAGEVYVAYEIDDAPSGRSEVRFVRSLDFGATWSTSQLLGTRPSQTLRSGFTFRQWVDVAAAPGGLVYVAWADDRRVSFARSNDSGASFEVDVDIDPVSAGISKENVDLCADDAQVVLAWGGGDNVALVSEDEGVSWSQRADLTEGLILPLARTAPLLACADDGQALAIWSGYADIRADPLRSGVGYRHFDGSAWGPVETAQDFEGDAVDVSATFSRSNEVLVAVLDSPTGVWIYRSTDGGRSLGSPERRNVDTWSPRSTIGLVRVSADGEGNAWVFWLEAGVGSNAALLGQHSGDGGVTWSSTRRVDGDESEGARGTILQGAGGDVGTLPGAAFIAYAAGSELLLADALVASWAPGDLDFDGAPSEVDCAPDDPSVYPGAPEVADGKDNQCPGDPGFGLVDETAPTSGFRDADDKSLYSWDPMPGATLYEVVRGDDPRLDSRCEFATTDEASFRDERLPSPGGAFYYLNRVAEPFEGSWGAESTGGERAPSCD